MTNRSRTFSSPAKSWISLTIESSAQQPDQYKLSSHRYIWWVTRLKLLQICSCWSWKGPSESSKLIHVGHGEIEAQTSQGTWDPYMLLVHPTFLPCHPPFFSMAPFPRLPATFPLYTCPAFQGTQVGTAKTAYRPEILCVWALMCLKPSLVP